ncbi:MAG: ImmA/IrrE family metallo-endopeptidase [Candidatus Nealsonbacteria bacterium]|nr:ImmA/IrrE family metallo-endopeptidase [Candidatus Nealsonbacteria bacterium]
MLPELAREELSAALDTVVMELLAEATVAGPPVDAFRVARRLGIAVAEDDRQRGRARYVRLAGHRGRAAAPTILLRPEPRRERKHWAVAHEIGEHAALRVFKLLAVDPREALPGARETVANHVAGRLLLPTEWFVADAIACDWNLLELKSRYTSASHELIARRMLECGPSVIVSIYDHGRLYFRRSNLPGRVPPPSSAELQCWQTVHDRNHPEQTYEGLRTIQGWPVHEEDWRREILRTEVEEW